MCLLPVALVLTATARAATAAPPSNPAWPCSFAYVLQAAQPGQTHAEAVSALAASGRDLLVLDATAPDGSRWSTEDLRRIRAARPGRRILAYLSIGEAESYRRYWKPNWKVAPDGTRAPGTPSFIVAPNPDWPGNYKVRYWDPAWQSIVLAALDGILAQGFDGAYLDIVDAFEFFEYDAAGNTRQDGRPNPATGRSYRRDMVQWVKRVAAHARARHPGFLIIPQNGSQLLAYDDYLAAVDGAGVEDLFTVGDKKQPAAHVDYVDAYLDRAQAAGKPVLLIEYGEDYRARKQSIVLARRHDYLLLLTDRKLTSLGVSFPVRACR